MNFEKYKSDFKTLALKHDFDEEYVARCLEYAEVLNAKNLPIIYSQEHLASLLGFEATYINYIIYKPSKFYRSFKIPKKSGADRTISAPLPNLKKIQRWILDNILYRLDVSPYAKAFVKGKSIKENARFHRNQTMVLTLDIKDFFSSISTSKIELFFCNCGYSRRVSCYLTRLCTLDGGLPQGASTSPALSNLIFSKIDFSIASFCLEKKIRYTRYADDLTFSGDFLVGEVIRFVRDSLSTSQLKLNENKTRVMYQNQRQDVTGIVVNEKLQANRELRRSLRQAAYYIEKFGLDYHIAKTNQSRANYKNHLLGLSTFVRFINPNDRDAIKIRNVLFEDS